MPSKSSIMSDKIAQSTTFSTESPVEKHEMSSLDVTIDDSNASTSAPAGSVDNAQLRAATSSRQPATTGIVQPSSSSPPRPEVAPLVDTYMLNARGRVFADIFVLLAFALIIVAMVTFGKPYHRGFNCDDESIRYPYHGDTFTTLALGLYPTIILVVSITLNEFFIVRAHFAGHAAVNKSTKSRIFVWQVYAQIVPLTFAIIGSQFVTHVSKYTIGRLRPHFIDLCQPRINSTGEVITRFSNCSFPNTYHIDYECTRPEEFVYQMTDSHLSFMSGHSSHMAVSMVYLMLYFESRFRWRDLQRAKHAIQTLLFAFAFWVALTRISDYKHHWSDVLVGGLQGTIFAILTALYASDLFKFDNRKHDLSAQSDSAVSINMNV